MMFNKRKYMHRTEMLNRAIDVAVDQVYALGGLNDAQYREMKKLKNDEKAIQTRAKEILEEAAMDLVATIVNRR